MKLEDTFLILKQRLIIRRLFLDTTQLLKTKNTSLQKKTADYSQSSTNELHPVVKKLRKAAKCGSE
jgi:hypothetical protein